jgi:TrmH family RNA methyltransferase
MAVPRIIRSRDNPRLKALLDLAGDARQQRRQRRTILDGTHLIEAYGERIGSPILFVVSDAGSLDAEVSDLLARYGASAEVLQVTDGVFRELSGVTTPVGILAVIEIPEPSDRAPESSCVLLDAIQDSGNVGAILRTAAAAGVEDIFLGPGCAGAWSPRVLRAGQGAHFGLRIREQANLAQVMEDYPGISVATVVENGTALFDIDLDGEIAWLFGNEGAGVDPALVARATRRATIPLSSSTESLNVAAAAAVCLFEGLRQRRGRRH